MAFTFQTKVTRVCKFINMLLLITLMGKFGNGGLIEFRMSLTSQNMNLFDQFEIWSFRILPEWVKFDDTLIRCQIGMAQEVNFTRRQRPNQRVYLNGVLMELLECLLVDRTFVCLMSPPKYGL